MVLDLIIVLIVLLFTFLGYRKGLVKTAISILSFFIALVVSIMLYKTVGNLVINNTKIDETIETAISSKVITEDFEEKYEMLPDSLVETGETTVNEISKSLSHKIIYVSSFIVLFIVLKIVLIFAKFLAGIITKIPVIKQFDKLRWNNIWFSKRYFNCDCHFCNCSTCFTNDGGKIYQYY